MGGGVQWGRLGVRDSVRLVPTKPKYSLSWILPLVRQSLNSPAGFAFEAYVDGVFKLLEDQHVEGIQKFPPGSHENFTYDLKKSSRELVELATEAFFYLIHAGIIVPAPPSESLKGIGPPYRLSFLGQRWREGGEPVPEDYDGYLNFLHTLIPALDTVIAQYVSEGLSSFVRQSYFAAAVMIGAASEKAIYLLADSMSAALRKPADRTKLTDLLGRRSLKALFDFITKKITDTSVQKIIPYAVGEDAETHLMSLFAAIRVQRNDAVHPMNAQVSAEAVRLSFSAFPHALKKTQDLRDWFNKNHGTI